MGEVADGRQGRFRMRGQQPGTLQFSPQKTRKNGGGKPAYTGSWSGRWKWSFAIQALEDSDHTEEKAKDQQDKELMTNRLAQF